VNAANVTEISKRCVRISRNFVERTWVANAGGTPANLSAVSVPLFSVDAFGPATGPSQVYSKADFVTEVTEPITYGAEAGFDQNNAKCFRKFTLTAIGSLRSPNGASVTTLETREVGRARVVTGPFDCGD
jgi:hypothetical protein